MTQKSRVGDYPGQGEPPGMRTGDKKWCIWQEVGYQLHPRPSRNAMLRLTPTDLSCCTLGWSHEWCMMMMIVYNFWEHKWWNKILRPTSVMLSDVHSSDLEMRSWRVKIAYALMINSICTHDTESEKACENSSRGKMRGTSPNLW